MLALQFLLLLAADSDRLPEHPQASCYLLTFIVLGANRGGQQTVMMSDTAHSMHVKNTYM